MTSTAIRKKMDSLAGSTYGQSTDTESESVDQKRKEEWSVRWWINKLKNGFRQFLKYRIDQHGELCSAILLYVMEHSQKGPLSSLAYVPRLVTGAHKRP